MKKLTSKKPPRELRTAQLESVAGGPGHDPPIGGFAPHLSDGDPPGSGPSSK